MEDKSAYVALGLPVDACILTGGEELMAKRPGPEVQAAKTRGKFGALEWAAKVGGMVSFQGSCTKKILLGRGLGQTQDNLAGGWRMITPSGLRNIWGVPDETRGE